MKIKDLSETQVKEICKSFGLKCWKGDGNKKNIKYCPLMSKDDKDWGACNIKHRKWKTINKEIEYETN